MSLKIERLCKNFGERRVLKEVTLDIKEGEILFVLGKSGTGKSVLLKTIVGLLNADAGEIWVDEEEVSKFSEKEFFRIRKKCGMVFQHPALFDSLTVFENVAFGLRKHFDLSEEQVVARVNRCLDLVHLENIHQKLPSEISYGMQKRVSLARTIAIEPKILLFDEPTTGLDPVTTTAINNLIFDLSRTLKTTSIVVSHDIVCAMATADRIAVLDSGQILALGTRDEIKTSRVPLVQEFLAEVIE